MLDYAAATGYRKAELQSLEKDLAACKASSCSNLAAIEKQLARARADDEAIRTVEHGLLQSWGVGEYKDFEDIITRGYKDTIELAKEQRRQEYIGSAVHTPVVVWCNSGYKAEDLVPPVGGRASRPNTDCVWDILGAWAEANGIRPFVQNTPSVSRLYEVIWRREIIASRAIPVWTGGVNFRAVPDSSLLG